MLTCNTVRDHLLIPTTHVVAGHCMPLLFHVLA